MGLGSLAFEEYLKIESPFFDQLFNLSSSNKFHKARGYVFEVEWKEVGLMGGKRVRQIVHRNVLAADRKVRRPFAALVVVERFPELYFPLSITMANVDESADGVVYRVNGQDILVLAKDYGGNIPMVHTRAWVWTANGPMRIEVESPIRQGISKVAPGHSCYETFYYWPALRYTSWCWPPGEQPKKPEVDEEINIWFQLQGHRLVVKRAQWRKSNVQDSKRATIRSKRWP